MAYRVSAMAGIGTSITVIVSTAEQAAEKIDGYREDGFTEIIVRNLDGALVDLGELSTGAG